MAPLIADVPGLLWKIWVLGEETRIGGGVYLLADPPPTRCFWGPPGGGGEAGAEPERPPGQPDRSHQGP
jgi:hypothetical protein